MADWQPPAEAFAKKWSPPDAAFQQKPQDGGSTVGALWKGFLHGAGDIVYGGAQIGARMGEATDTGFGPEMAPGSAQRVDQAARSREQAYQTSPAVAAHPIASGTGRVGGTVASTAPLAALPGGGAATFLGRLGLAAAMGALAGSTQPVTEGDYWTEKTKQVGAGGAAGVALPAVGRALAPVGNAAVQAMRGAGVPLTPGMANPLFGPIERTMSAFPILRGWINGGEQRSIDGFNRAALNQALEPIGVRVPRTVKAGHDLMTTGADALSNAYDRILPQMKMNGPAWLRSASNKLQTIADELPADDARRFNTMIDNRFNGRFGPTGEMDGKTFKQAESYLSGRARSYIGTSSDELGRALTSAVSLMRDELANQNPALAPQLRNINSAYAMFTRIERAANGAANNGRFTPADLLKASRSMDPSRDHQAFAKGDALMQAFAQTGDDVLHGVTLSPLKKQRVVELITGTPIGAALTPGYAAMKAARPIGRMLPDSPGRRRSRCRCAAKGRRHRPAGRHDYRDSARALEYEQRQRQKQLEHDDHAADPKRPSHDGYRADSVTAWRVSYSSTTVATACSISRSARKMRAICASSSCARSIASSARSAEDL